MRLNPHGSFILSNGHSGPAFQTKDGSGISGHAQSNHLGSLLIP
jgi:hypothetical protein